MSCAGGKEYIGILKLSIAHAWTRLGSLCALNLAGAHSPRSDSLCLSPFPNYPWCLLSPWLLARLLPPPHQLGPGLGTRLRQQLDLFRPPFFGARLTAVRSMADLLFSQRPQHSLSQLQALGLGRLGEIAPGSQHRLLAARKAYLTRTNATPLGRLRRHLANQVVAQEVRPDLF